MTRNFRELLEARWAEGKFVCVGLDSRFESLPACVRGSAPEGVNAVLEFNKQIVRHTKDKALAFKANIAFYEALGPKGLFVLLDTIVYINTYAPGVPVILDVKRADIDSTNEGYVLSAFDFFNADAVTVHPYLGVEAMKPFLERKEKGIIVLCRTSNKGAGEFQDLIQQDGRPLYQHVADRVATYWNANGNCCLVVGATAPAELAEVRKIVGDMPILIPGIGAQGGDLEATVKAGRDSRDRGMIINSSRGIIFASKGEDYPEAARRETIKLHDQITACLSTEAQRA